jgi:hypothetical protein
MHNADELTSSNNKHRSTISQSCHLSCRSGATTSIGRQYHSCKVALSQTVTVSVNCFHGQRHTDVIARFLCVTVTVTVIVLLMAKERMRCTVRCFVSIRYRGASKDNQRSSCVFSSL